MSKRPSFGSQFEKLKSLGVGKAFDERKQAVGAQVSDRAPQTQSMRFSSILGQSLAAAGPVQPEQGPKNQVSALDSVTPDLSPIAKRTGSTADTVDAPTAGFTRVPHCLLRGEAKFEDPLDFMVYLHLFTYSHGFGRREAHMSQAQLERFTGAAKNTIKRSLERLSAKGWIKCIEEYECARMSRKWRVFLPADQEEVNGPGRKQSVSKSNRIQVAPRQERTGRLSSTDTLTVSKFEPFKESVPKERTENSLSPKTPVLREYLASVKPFGKRESEWRAYVGLRHEFAEEQIEECLKYLREQGIPGSSAPCHSPLRFLAQAMRQVWESVEAQRSKRGAAESRAQAELEAEARRLAEEAEAVRESEARERVFERAYPNPVTQAEVLGRYRERYPLLGVDGPVFRRLAIGAWWTEVK